MQLPPWVPQGSSPDTNVLLDVPSQQRQVQDQRQPVSVDKEQEGQESMYGSLGNDVCVEAVAEVYRVDVVAVPRKDRVS